MKERKINCKRVVLVIVAVLLFSMDSVTAGAATADDLREIVGDKRVTDETVIKDLKTIIYRYRQTEYKKKLIKVLDSMGDFGYEDSFNEMVEKKDKSLEVLEKSFRTNDNENIVIGNLNNSISVLNELGALKEPNSYLLDGFGEEDYEIAYQYATSVLDSINDNYDIGKIGEGVTFPTKDTKKLYRTFGENAIVTSDVSYENNKGIDLYVASSGERKYKPKILAQFNGTVKSIEEKRKGKSRITIAHGSSLITVYEYVSNVKIKVGDKVKQYQLLGYAAGDTLHFEMILNTIPINPLFIYGDLGGQVYNQWYGENPGMAREITDFSAVKKYADNTTREEKKDKVISSTVSEDGKKESSQIKLEEGYVNPEVPIVDYIEEEKQSR